jgi:hypothetical protein
MRVQSSFAGIVAALLLFGTAAAAPKEKPKKPDNGIVDVVVTEVAGTHAYLKPGATAGVRRGAKVIIGDTEYVVSMATSSYAIIDLGDSPPKEGAKGKATAVDESEEPIARPQKPRPDSAFEGVWPTAEPPSSGKAVKFVPLGDIDTQKKTDVQLMVLGGGTFPIGDRGGSFAHAELNARVRAEPFSAPVALLLDASVQNWFGPGVSGRDGNSARPILRARELMLAYGSQDGFSAYIGRMRYAAATLGTLDGLRLRTTVGDGGFALAAFGGLLPQPDSSTPATDAQRFGAEASYSDPKSPLRPEAAVVINGSTFHGGLDERRISGIVGLFPGNARFGAHVEIGSYPAGNPFKADAIEINNGGLDGSILFGPVQLGIRIDMRKPERSLWLASYFPLSFFCLTVPPTAAQATDTKNAPPIVCDGRTPTRVEGALDATISLDRVIIAGGANTARDVAVGGLPSMLGAFVNARILKIAEFMRADAGVSYTSATYMRMLGLTAGPGATVLDEQLDLGAYYRFASIQYDAGGQARSENGVGALGTFIPNRQFAISLQAEAIKGSDVDALVAFVTAMWRPQF